jgi:hypothetical protein
MGSGIFLPTFSEIQRPAERLVLPTVTFLFEKSLLTAAVNNIVRLFLRLLARESESKLT